MRKSLYVVFALSLMFAFLFAAGGAGIFGSPFSVGGPARDKLVWLLTILAGPVACLVALAVHGRQARLASIPLLAGACLGAWLGTLTAPFRDYWEKPFLLFVWLPMTIAALVLWSARPARLMVRVGLVYCALTVMIIAALAWRIARAPDPLAGPHRVDLRVQGPAGGKVSVTLNVDDRSLTEEKTVPCEFTVTGSKISYTVRKLDKSEGEIQIQAYGYVVNGGSAISPLPSEPGSVSGRVVFVREGF